MIRILENKVVRSALNERTIEHCDIWWRAPLTSQLHVCIALSPVVFLCLSSPVRLEDEGVSVWLAGFLLSVSEVQCRMTVECCHTVSN